MDRGIVGAIYFKLNTAFLRNERARTDNFIGMLEDEAKGKDLEKMLGFGIALGSLQVINLATAIFTGKKVTL